MNFRDFIAPYHSRNQGICFYRYPGEQIIHGLTGTETTEEATASTQFLFFPFDRFKSKALRLAIQQEFSAMQLKDLLAIMKTPETFPKPFEFKCDNTTSSSFEPYQSLFEKAKVQIEMGLLQKVILSKREAHPFDPKNSFVLFQKLLEKHPNAYCFLFYHPECGAWIGASPELVLTRNENYFSTTALAGTKASETEEWGTKEIEEHSIVSDFIYNSLKSISSSINRNKTYTSKAGKLFHLKQDISFESTTKNLLNIIDLLHPTPAIGGLPQADAVRFIKAQEPHPRKYYCGFLGKTSRQEARIFVNLRSAEIQSKQIIIYAGGGITKDSELEKEWEECRRKAENISSLL